MMTTEDKQKFDQRFEEYARGLTGTESEIMAFRRQAQEWFDLGYHVAEQVHCKKLLSIVHEVKG